MRTHVYYCVPVVSPIVASLDYGRLNMVRLTFSSCQRVSCINITIYDDTSVERQREQFFIALHPYPGSPAGLRVNSRSTIEILDNDGMQSEDTKNDQFDGVCTVYLSFCQSP